MTKARRGSRQRLLLLQKKIFLSLQSEARRLLGDTPKAIKIYEKECRADVPKDASLLRPVSKAKLIQAIRKADVSFIGDYHTFPQAQRTALRLIRDSILPEETGSWFIGVELVASHHQRALDDWQDGRISTERFLERIHYSQDWGFPWQNYAGIFEWAKAHSVRLIALNRPKALSRSHAVSATLRSIKDVQELHDRDQWAAGVITDVLEQERRTGKTRASAKQQRKAGAFSGFSSGFPKMIVLQGELHVGTKHLPRQLTRVSRAFLGKPLTWITILQNQDRLYWQLARKGKELHTQILKLKENCYCVLSSTPWSKLQSLVSWAEGGMPGSASEAFVMDFEDGDEEIVRGPDYLSLIRTYGNMLAEFLEVPAPSYENITVLSIEEADFADQLSPEFSTLEKKLIRFHVVNNFRAYIPRDEIAYLGSASHNAATELAAVYLQRSVTGSKGFFSPEPHEGIRIALEACFGFLGSLMLNPRRKCDLPTDHARRIRDLQKGEKADWPGEAESRKLTLQLLSAIESSQPVARVVTVMKSALSSPTQYPSMMVGCRLFGQILAKRLHEALLEEKIPLSAVRKIFFSRARLTWEDRLLFLAEASKEAPLAPSKSESL